MKPSLSWLAVATVLALAPMAARAADPLTTPPSSLVSEDRLSVPYAVPWRPGEVIGLAEKVGDYQLATLAGGVKPDPRGWEQGALFVGLTALADHSSRPEFAEAVLARGQANGWKLGDRPYDADDFVIGQSYAWAASHGGGDAALSGIEAKLDAVLANPPKNGLDFTGDGSACRDRWCWCDALFMGPELWLAMSRISGDPRYADYAKSEFEATTAKLYDPQAHLYYRDSRFFTRTDINGSKLFWSRGNGWVFAGLARMISLLPDNDPERARMVTVFQAMAAELKSIQKPDGFWSPSLLGDPETALPESSGTGFYTYGFAWGIKAGLLDKPTYEPVVRKGWAALVASVHPDGKLGYVQPVSDRPDAVAYDDTQLYGVGAFLMAATAVADLDLAPVVPLPARLQVSNPSAYDQKAALVEMPVSLAGALPGDTAGGWSVEAAGQTYAAEKDGQVFRFVMPLKAHETVDIALVPQAAPLPRRTLATLNVQDGGTLDGKLIKGGVFHLRKAFTVPKDYFIHDGLIAFEGVGWESGEIAYRVYLDERNATDIFGKRLPRPVLGAIGQGFDNYHDMADWGRDIFQVDASLGIGGIGEERDGKAAQVGMAKVSASVDNPGPVTARATVDNDGFDHGRAKLETRYTIHAGSPVTFVDASAKGMKGPVAAGFRHHDGVDVVKEAANGQGWGYVATWGMQSLNNDQLGLVLFYRGQDVIKPDNDDGLTLYATFKDPKNVHYAYAAVWQGGLSGVSDEAGFKAWLAATLDGLNHPATVTIHKP